MAGKSRLTLKKGGGDFRAHIYQVIHSISKSTKHSQATDPPINYIPCYTQGILS
jgi:hypothetical protein